MAKVALFLGAGASRAFDYPTTLDFVNILRNFVTGQEKGLLDLISKSQQVSDIEHVLQRIDSLINFGTYDYGETLFKETKFGGLGLFDKSWNAVVSLHKSLKEIIVGELHVQYEWDSSRIDKIINDYSLLFAIFRNINQSVQLDIFTSNYDSVIERFCVDSKLDVASTCGFITDNRSGRQFWNSEELHNWNEMGKDLAIRLYKLHGSLDWRETIDNRIERVLTEDRVPSRTRRYKRNILIYPAQKNYATEEPFRRLQRYFEEILNQHNTCLIIGFSFRDPLINNTFLDFLRENNKRKLVVVSPNASRDVTENLLGGETQLRKQVEYIPKLFGVEETFNEISKVLGAKFHVEKQQGIRDQE